MKKILNSAGLMLAFMLLLLSCKKDERSLNENLTPVGALVAPLDQAAVQLEPTTSASVIFMWEKTVAADGDFVLYEIAFDKETGDFSKPVYKSVSDGGGVQNQITFTHKVLTKIAALAGIQSSSTGKLKWTVIASKATNKKAAAVSRILTLTRPAGFAEVPAELYLTGSATEGGTDITKAIMLKKLEAGVFEVFTSLKPGTYQLTDKASADGKKFFIEGTVIKEGATMVTVTDPLKIYHIRYDFNVASVLETTEIQSLGLFMSAYNTEIAQLDYAGNGVFASPVTPIQFYQFSWGRDERYKFAAHTPAGIIYYGSTNANNVSPVGQPASYFYLTPVSNNQWDNTYKFNPSADMHNVKVTVNFGAFGPYTHEVTTL
ncbi:MAG: SusE domain-containing protein [Ferruginibacter sp.]